MNVVRLKKIGHGGFGNVFHCQDIGTGKDYALKEICSSEDEGISCLIEIHIMSTAKHKTINKAQGVSIEGNKMIIFQEYAKSDLKTWREQNLPTDDLIQKIIHQVTSGLDYLHRYLGIIHGDLKTGNILCFPNNSFKITDFSVSVDKSWNNKGKSLCTNTHRPPEIWLGESFDEQVDLWSLGCMLHDLILNFKLFPHQAIGLNKQERKNKKQEIFERSMNVIYDWAAETGQLKDLDYQKTSTPYEPLEKCQYYSDNLMNRLMFSLLKIDPKKRLTTQQVLSHEFLKNKNRNPNRGCEKNIKDYSSFEIHEDEKELFSSFDQSTRKILEIHLKIIRRAENKIPCWNDIAKHSLILYYRVHQRLSSFRLALHAACFYTASNLVLRTNLSKAMIERLFQIPFSKVIEVQKKVCFQVDFSFY